ncbi:YjdF family protein [Marinisporobacter balticus]|uniref:DUF2992 family protein n=1 Tax=Marinisporobacter balticus TaxID=2018667 RepID=A0A4V2SC01_9FIRM|nr:YjdF family protein [Marinisporobacter balticus]TCO77470.1 DUF2992 family protein [Marinisporobacter balticus]
MNKVKMKFTVFFEGPFWIGLIEKMENDHYQTAKIIFGPEPKDYEVHDFILKNYFRIKFSNPIQNGEGKEKKINPKRLQRKIQKELENIGMGTKAQLALKEQYSVNKKERKKISKEYQEEQKRIKFELKQQKKKEKKKGH